MAAVVAIVIAAGACGQAAPEAPPEGAQQPDVYVVDLADGAVTRLTNDAGLEGSLYWLTDGSRLAYWWKEPGPEGGWGTYHQVLATVRADGSDRRDLGPVQTTYAPAAVSPDRRSIVFSGDGSEDGSSGLVLLDLVAGARRQLTTLGETGAVWSPDGSRILAYLPSRRVVIVDPMSGHELVRIPDVHVQEVIGWTPDGLSVLYRSCTDDLDKDACWSGQLVAADLDGTNVRPYAGPLPTETPDTTAVSPDGQWVASWANGRVTVTPSSGGAAVQVATGGPAAWSPDSAWLVFTGSGPQPTATGEARPFVLFAVHRDGGPAIQLTDGPYDGVPAWRPE
jgi:Tol biopolymer transport system component